jgi:hypothetical protein
VKSVLGGKIVKAENQGDRIGKILAYRAIV